MKVVFLTTPELRAEHWQQARTLLGRVVDEACHGEFDLADLDQMVSDGSAIAVIGGEYQIAMVFEFVSYPRKQVINIMAIAGSGLQQAAVTFLGIFREWAAESGFNEIEACVSPAMARFLQPIGFKHTYDLVRMPC